MKTLLIQLVRQARIFELLGPKKYWEYRLARKSALVSVRINGINVVVRKGTMDLSVAISCLKGEFEVLRYLLPRDYQGVIVDAGGYIGTAAIALSNMFPKSQIITIEPSLENMEILKKNVEGIENIRIIFGALIAGDEEKIRLVNRGTGHWGYTAVTNPLDSEGVGVLHETAAVNLESLGVNVEDIGVLKLDIEGGELDLLKNDVASLKRIPNIIVELHDRVVAGCREAFFDFSKDRIVISDRGEKFLSIKRDSDV